MKKSKKIIKVFNYYYLFNSNDFIQKIILNKKIIFAKNNNIKLPNKLLFSLLF